MCDNTGAINLTKKISITFKNQTYRKKHHLSKDHKARGDCVENKIITIREG